jgi:hypothetical protein
MYNDLDPDKFNLYPKVGGYFQIDQTKINTNLVPRCFDKCVDPYCNMKHEHCSNRDFPPRDKCVKCELWFTNLEK